MSEKVIDIGTQSTLENIHDSLVGSSGMFVVPANGKSGLKGFKATTSSGKIYATGEITTGTECVSAIIYHENIKTNVLANVYKPKYCADNNCSPDVYVLPDNSDTIYRMTSDEKCWEPKIKIPFKKIDVNETCITSYYNPVTKKNEIHLLGGYGILTKAHYKWDGENWSVASELPFDFCAGKAVVFQDSIHIFGSTTKHYQYYSQSGFKSSHASWDGNSWTLYPDVPGNIYGATPISITNRVFIDGVSSSSKNAYNDYAILLIGGAEEGDRLRVCIGTFNSDEKSFDWALRPSQISTTTKDEICNIPSSINGITVEGFNNPSVVEIREGYDDNSLSNGIYVFGGVATNGKLSGSAVFFNYNKVDDTGEWMLCEQLPDTTCRCNTAKGAVVTHSVTLGSNYTVPCVIGNYAYFYDSFKIVDTSSANNLVRIWQSHWVRYQNGYENFMPLNNNDHTMGALSMGTIMVLDGKTKQNIIHFFQNSAFTEHVIVAPCLREGMIKKPIFGTVVNCKPDGTGCFLRESYSYDIEFGNSFFTKDDTGKICMISGDSWVNADTKAKYRKYAEIPSYIDSADNNITYNIKFPKPIDIPGIMINEIRYYNGNIHAVAFQEKVYNGLAFNHYKLIHYNDVYRWEPVACLPIAKGNSTAQFIKLEELDGALYCCELTTGPVNSGTNKIPVNIHLYKFNGLSWDLSNSEEFTINSNQKIPTIDLISYQNKIQLIFPVLTAGTYSRGSAPTNGLCDVYRFIFSGNNIFKCMMLRDNRVSLDLWNEWGADSFNGKPGFSKSDWYCLFKFKAFVINGHIQIFMLIEDPYILTQYETYDFMNTGGLKISDEKIMYILSVYLQEGHKIVCDKNIFLPHAGIVYDADDGYIASDSGTYKFVVIADSDSATTINTKFNVPYTIV